MISTFGLLIPVFSFVEIDLCSDLHLAGSGRKRQRAA